MAWFTKLLLIFSFFFSSLRFGFVPTVVIDAAAPGAPVSSRASGYLYGLAEAGVPSDLMAQSLDIASVSQKVPGGLQHPIGDLSHVVGALDAADYLVVYLQDHYSTWYYENDTIYEARKAGTYDPSAFLREDYLPRVEASVRRLSAEAYADRVVYCPFNECDNGVWFGETAFWDDGNVYGAFNETGRDRFFAAWKETYDMIRALQPDVKIGGPGYYEYNAEKERDFLSFCKANDCVPDVMIYHELGDLSSRLLTDHATEYRALEKMLGIEPLPVIVTEYGTMQECGNPAAMLPYVCGFESAGIYGDVAYWRLANNLNDNTADDNMPNACWWLYRWYADLEGNVLAQEKHDLFHGDFEKAVREGRELKYKDFYTLPVLSPEKDRIQVLCGAAAHTGQLRFDHLSATALGKNVRVQVEEVQFRGLTGAVTTPTLLLDRNVFTAGDSLTVPLRDMREGAVYLVTVTPAGAANETPGPCGERYEAEHGKLLGNAYTYDSAYATTGEIAGMVGGMENPGDGVELTVCVPKSGAYDLDLIYGKANDGSRPADRVTGVAKLTVNGNEDDALRISLPNTIRSEYTSALNVRVQLKMGKNTLRFAHDTGTFVLDSVLLTSASVQQNLKLLAEKESAAENTTAYLAVAPADGYYAVACKTSALTVDGAAAGTCDGTTTVYLRRGLNLLTLAGKNVPCVVSANRTPSTPGITPDQMTLSGAAKIENGLLCGIGSETSGEARITVTAPTGGDYRVTLCYSNNAEGGYHAYNVDLIEEYFTVCVNGGAPVEVMCRNTYSAENFSTVTFNITLHEGENELVFSNDGAIRFDGKATQAPTLKWISFNPVKLS